MERLSSGRAAEHLADISLELYFEENALMGLPIPDVSEFDSIHTNKQTRDRDGSYLMISGPVGG